MPKSNAFKTTKINIKSSVNFTPESIEKIEEKFLGFEASKTDSVREQRDAAIAAARSTIAQNRSIIEMTELLKAASQFDDRIAAENTWIAYKNSDGDIIFEGITERIQRNALRASIQNMGSNQEEFPSDKDMYEEGDSEE